MDNLSPFNLTYVDTKDLIKLSTSNDIDENEDSLLDLLLGNNDKDDDNDLLTLHHQNQFQNNNNNTTPACNPPPSLFIPSSSSSELIFVPSPKKKVENVYEKYQRLYSRKRRSESVDKYDNKRIKAIKDSKNWHETNKEKMNLNKDFYEECIRLKERISFLEKRIEQLENNNNNNRINNSFF